MTDCELIIIGDELLKGERTDAHIGYLGRALRRYGVRVEAAHVVGDGVDRIAEAVRTRLARTRVLIVAGGLGPTPDDVTRAGVARGLGLPLEFHEDSWQAICSFFEERGRTATDANRQQAQFPRGAEVLGNLSGTAPGFAVDAGGTTTFVLPGPPHELQRMFERDVAPRIAALFERPPLRVETFRTFGVGESQLMEWFGEMLEGVGGYDVSSLPWITGVDIILTARRDADTAVLDADAARVELAFRDRLGNKFYEHGERSMAEVVGAMLTRRKETLAIAESLTGGMISSLLTDTPGASAYFMADAVTYSNESKATFAGVDPEAIRTDGAVSESVCRGLADGVRERCAATWGLSTTGIAGPGGGTDEKPVGLTWLGLSWNGGGETKKRIYAGGRADIRGKAAFGALWMLYDRLIQAGSEGGET